MEKALARHMMVVDDDPAFRELMIQFFGRKGWKVLTAETADEGIALFRRHHPAAVILDVNLGTGRSGLSLCEQIRDDISSERTAILILSADRRTVEDQVRGRTAGADGYLIKPVALTVLEERLTEILRK